VDNPEHQFADLESVLGSRRRALSPACPWLAIPHQPRRSSTCPQRLEHDHRDLSGRSTPVVLRPPWIRLETTGDMNLPLFAAQLTGLHLD
jgi:hypothetical protein